MIMAMAHTGCYGTTEKRQKSWILGLPPQKEIIKYLGSDMIYSTYHIQSVYVDKWVFIC